MRPVRVVSSKDIPDSTLYLGMRKNCAKKVLSVRLVFFVVVGSLPVSHQTHECNKHEEWDFAEAVLLVLDAHSTH